MIEIGSLIIVAIITAVFYSINPKAYKWWEFFIPLFVVLLSIMISKTIIKSSKVSFDEYWGQTVSYVIEEEPWNRWVTKICTEEYACGTDKDGNTVYCTRTYDCSYQDDIGPSWYAVSDLGKKFSISESLHDSIVSLFNTPKITVETRRNHSSRSKASNSRGTKFEGKQVGQTSNILKTIWDKTDDTRKGIFTKHTYVNKIKSSDLSLFNISVVTEQEADSLGLFKYPNHKDIFNFPTILGNNISKETQDKFKRLNAKFGPTNQLRLWVLVFEDKPQSIASYQENYWVNGNKNELVICIGTQNGKITWSHAFSWALSTTFTAEVKSKILDLYEITLVTKEGNKTSAIPIVGEVFNSLNLDILNLDDFNLNDQMVYIFPKVEKENIIEIKKSPTPVLTDNTWNALYDYLNKNLHRFERRSFEEFSYIRVKLSNGNIIFLYILAFALSFGVNMWCYHNDIVDETKKSKKYENSRSRIKRF